MASVEVHQRAFAAALLHALQHSSSHVCGALLGFSRSDGTVELTGALPLVHSSVGYAPTLEIALSMASERARSVDAALAGVYFAPEHCDEPAASESSSLSKLHARIADRVHAHFPGACCLLLNNSALATLDASFGTCSASNNEIFFHVYRKDESGGSWPRSPSGWSLSHPSAPSFVARLLKCGHHRRLVDFDDHLEDICNNDWLNEHLFSKVLA